MGLLILILYIKRYLSELRINPETRHCHLLQQQSFSPNRMWRAKRDSDAMHQRLRRRLSILWQVNLSSTRIPVMIY